MMIKGAVSGLVPAMLVATLAQGQTTIDVAKISCDQFVLTTVASPDYIAVWLSGYYHGKRNSTVIDVEQLKNYAQSVKSYCLYSGKGKTLMEAVETVIGMGK
jgi:acid stress chaperone HdeB